MAAAVCACALGEHTSAHVKTLIARRCKITEASPAATRIARSLSRMLDVDPCRDDIRYVEMATRSMPAFSPSIISTRSPADLRRDILGRRTATSQPEELDL
jgi:hypothetical protein